ncbi:MAG: hypothetical protein CMJ21_00625 [Phycisphaerae bacterium]|nr:hypothetical protein [Phycisphaerae bacterium]
MTHSIRSQHRRGFTVLELVVVIAILVALAGSAVMMMDRVEMQAESQITLGEMDEIKRAIVQFKKDTGFLPKQGPFDLDTRAGGFVPLVNIPAFVPVAQKTAWFDSPANFWQLYENPLIGTGHALEDFNPVTARGWNGPYLSRRGEGLVDIGDNLQTDGSGSPTAGVVLPQVYGVADPYVSTPIGSYLVWRPSDGATPYARWGRPYFLFDLDQDSLARIVGSGDNAIYEGGAGDDVVAELLR